MEEKRLHPFTRVLTQVEPPTTRCGACACGELWRFFDCSPVSCLTHHKAREFLSSGSSPHLSGCRVWAISFCLAIWALSSQPSTFTVSPSGANQKKHRGKKATCARVSGISGSPLLPPTRFALSHKGWRRNRALGADRSSSSSLLAPKS